MRVLIHIYHDRLSWHLTWSPPWGGSDVDQHLQRRFQSITFLRWKVLSKLASIRRAPTPVSLIIHTILDLRILHWWKLKPQKLSTFVTGLNQLEKTDLISGGHDESCQSNVLEQSLAKAIISKDYKCLPKTQCWKTSRTSRTCDGNLGMNKVGKSLCSEFSECS